LAAAGDEGVVTNSLTALLGTYRERKLFSGAEYVVGTADTVLATGATGTTSWESDVPVDEKSLWDIASLTKPIVALAVMVLAYKGELSLDDPVARWLPEYQVTDKAPITVAQLLTHTSGIPGQQPMYLTCPTREDLLASLTKLPLRFPRGTDVEYTSQGFMVLGEILERVTGRLLDEILEELVLGRLGMRDTMFCPPPGLQAQTVATERCPWRGRLVKGTVHDENADVLGGVAGHAGLFSTASDLSRLGRVFLGRGRLDGEQVLPASVVGEMTIPRTDGLGLRRCYGWQGADQVGCPVGQDVSAVSYGHTGFTGTSLWVDPPKGLYVVLLSNAVHPVRRPEGLSEVRPAFHHLAFSLAPQ
jgi:CubicO group peptidase (beta-lactamase class C family)